MLSYTQLAARDVHPGDYVAVYNARRNAPTWKQVTKAFIDSPFTGQVTFWLSDGQPLQQAADQKIGVRGR